MAGRPRPRSRNVRLIGKDNEAMIKVIGLLTRKPELTHEQFVKRSFANPWAAACMPSPA